MKRNLTRQEEQVIRLCHHDHEGLSVDDAAVKMGLSRDSVMWHLRHIKKKAPQLFPILSHRRRAIIEMYNHGAFELQKHPIHRQGEPMYVWKHPSREAMAESLSITLSVLDREITFLRRHRFLWNRVMSQYHVSMDSQVKTKF